jgi:hypothetical protein
MLSKVAIPVSDLVRKIGTARGMPKTEVGNESVIANLLWELTIESYHIDFLPFLCPVQNDVLTAHSKDSLDSSKTAPRVPLRK